MSMRDVVLLKIKGNDDIELKKDIIGILDAMKVAKEYGSILELPAIDFKRINL